MPISNRAFDARLELIPKEPGVYLMKDTSGSVIYVGKAINLRNRLRNYFTPNPKVEPKIKAMISHIADFSYIICKNELEALILENNLIKHHRPKYNTLLRDDKEYPYIKVTLNEMYPRVMRAYRLGPDREAGARYYGPYLAGDLQRALKAIHRIFPVMTCNRKLPRDIDKDRPCLKYYINRCIGPCTSMVSREEYLQSIDEICRFLDGQHAELLNKIKNKMEQASEDMDFEKAAVWRDRYQDLLRLTESQVIVSTKGENIDVLGIARNGNEACLQKMEIRDGRMIGSVSSFVEDREEPDSILFEAFIKQHYAASSYIPKLILISKDLDEQTLLEDYLQLLSHKKVKFRKPLRGEKKKLVEMADRNAVQNLNRHTLIGGSAKGLAQTLMHLAEIFDLNEAPHRIEAYDMANLGTDDRTGAMVVFTEGKPKRSLYRHFHIKSFEGIDDYRAMAEVVTRRMERLGDPKFGAVPDLILLDGGMGHVQTILPIVNHYAPDIPVAGIVKDNRHRTHGLLLPDGRLIELQKNETVPDENPDERSKRLGLLRLCTAIQNEAHYFAGRLHKKARLKRTIHYTLEDIPGVGPARRRKLLQHFSTIKNISQANLSELKKVSGIPDEVAENIYEHFHRQDERNA